MLSVGKKCEVNKIIKIDLVGIYIMKNGLIMEGGAMRGMFTCGVTDVFMENGIVFDAAAGVSAGAIFGCNYKSKQIGRGIRYNKKYCNDSRYCSIKSLLMTGDMYNADFCYHVLPDILDPFDKETFASNPMDFHLVATDIVSGKSIYHKCDDGGFHDILWMRASASLPLVARPVVCEGHILLDGGITDSVPFEHMENLGYNNNVIILTQPKGYRKSKVPFFLSRIYKLFFRKYPKFVDALENRYIMYNKQMEEIEKREEEGSSLVIRPCEALGISRSEKNPKELERVYRMGRAQGREILPKVKEFLNQK